MTLYRQGSRGAMVAQIQRALHLKDDGIFGPLTTEAVKDFQAAHSLTVDGIVGPATLALLIPARLKTSKRHINEIIIHCTDTEEGKNYTIDDVRQWHTLPPPKGRGWSDVGYHYLIYRNGSVVAGRDVDQAGAHCKGHNSYSIAVCYVGGRGKDGKCRDTRTLQQRAAMANLLIELRMRYPQAVIVGHSFWDPSKECPCFDAAKEYKNY